MRKWIACLVLGCCAVTGYSQEVPAETPSAEVAQEDGDESSQVAVVDQKEEKPSGGGCGCGGKPKI
jgi:hypothetical protein